MDMNWAKGNWHAIGDISDIPLRGARCVRTPQGKIAVFRTAENEVFAIEDHCPHKGGPLSQGIVHGTAVTCPLHNWVISLETGKALGADEGAVRTIPVRNDGGSLFIALESLMIAAE
ncbi:nitrite reductase small subunit NirD [Ensifer sp. 4252]|uniref:nitrite reductase small subunit NirD n=1 Tax=Ensifer sp. 4252 TaxID=3373915 RepID=UPI003D209C22